MRKFIFTPLIALLLSFGLSFNLSAQDLMITGVMDATLSGGTPKAIELYVINDIADLSTYGIDIAANGNPSDGAPGYSFPADAVSAGTFLYVTGSTSENTEFNTWFGFDATYTNGSISFNGDDAIELYSGGSTVVDVFGAVGTDGTGESWEYTDGWAYRNADAAPTATFNAADWNFSGIDALEGQADNATATTPFPNGTFTMGGGSSFQFSEDFESGLGSVTLVNGTETNYWINGSLASQTGNALFVTNNGTDNIYTNNSTSTSHAYIPINFNGATNVTLNFDWICDGEGSGGTYNYDYLKVYLVPNGETIEAGTTLSSSYQIGDIYVNQTSLQNQEIIISSSEITQDNMNLVFSWKNDGSSGNNPPASVDNISLTEITCPAVSDFAVDAFTAYDATLSWTENGDATAWNIIYGAPGFDPETEGTTVTADAIPFTVESLTPETEYDFYVQTDCGSGDLSTIVGAVSATTLPSCLAPSDLLADAITSSSANLNWTENGTTDTWNIKVSSTSIDPETTDGDILASTSTMDNPYTSLSGLSANTTYYFYVQADCGSGDLSAWSSEEMFTTECDVISTFPWTEDFESISTPNLPDCWTVLNENSDSKYWKTYSSYGVSSSNAAGLYTDYNNGNNDDYLILPAVALTGNERLKFSLRARSSSEPNDYRVVLSTTGIDPSDFTNELVPLTEVSNTTMTEINPINLSAYSGTAYIAIHVPSGGLDGYYIYFDDFTIEELPSCIETSDFAVDSYTSTEVTLSWTENGDAIAWNIIYGAPGFDPATEGTTVTADAIPFTVESLTADTEYDFYVQSDCGSGDLSTLEGSVTVTTAITCPVPANITVTPSTDLAEVSWNAFGQTAWNIKVSSTSIDPATADGDILANEAITTNPYTVLNLDANTMYYVYIQSDCGSDWSAETTFTTECGVYALPTIETFDTFIPDCWYEFKGLLEASVTSTSNSSGWTGDDYLNSTSNGKCAKNNVYGTSRSDWMVTPSIDLGDGSFAYELKFNLGLTDYDYPFTADMDGSDDKFAVVISTDNGATWSDANTLRLWDNAGSAFEYNNIATLGEEIILSLNGYTGIVRIGFYVESTTFNADNDLFVDNVSIDLAPSCPQVSSFAVNSYTSTEVTLSWTEEGDASAWNIIYGAPGFDPETEGTTITADAIPFTVESLTPETEYDFHVQADCGSGDLSTLEGPVTATTAIACPIPSDIIATPSLESAEIIWNAYGETAWNIKVSTTSIDPTTEDGDILVNEAITTNPYTILNLNANTMYYVYIQSDCGSDWSSEITFNTECDIISSFPFTEGFEGSEMPNCWTILNIDDDLKEWKINTYNHFEGNQCASVSFNGNGNNDWLITPQFDLSSDNMIVEFSAKSTTSTFLESYNVLVSTTGTNPSDFTTVLENVVDAPEVWTTKQYNLSDFGISATDNIYIAIQCVSVDESTFYFDAFSIRETSNENAITAFTHASLTGEATIDASLFTVTAEAAQGTSLVDFVPTIEISQYATISPESGIAQDFSTGAIAYTVTSESGIDQVWNVTVTEATTQSSENNIITFVLDEEIAPAEINPGTVNISVQWHSDITSLIPTISVSTLATISPESGVAQDFTNPVTYTVTAEDGTTQDYIVTVTVEDTPQGATCANPYTVAIPADLPYADLNNTNCGYQDTYDDTNISSSYYDTGEDVVYELTITEESAIVITLDPKTTTYSSLSVFDACPETGNLIDDALNSGTNIRTLNLILDPGVYYIMIDTYTAPDCIADYDLTIEMDCITPINLEATDITQTDATITWSALAQSEWNLKVSTTSIDPTLATADVFDGIVSTNPEQDLTGLSAEATYYVYAQATCGSDWSSEYTFTTPSSCPQPIDVIASVGADMAQISWNALGMSEWNIKVSSTSIDPTTADGDIVANELTTDNPYTVSDLDANTSYYVYVQSSCDSDWSVEYMFTTSCAEITEFPYFEGFENGLNCWTIYNEDGDNNEWEITTANDLPYEGAQSAGVSFNGSGNNDWLISPQFIINSDDLLFDFYAKSRASSFLEDFNVLISTTGKQVADFTIVAENITNHPDAWIQHTYTLSELGISAGQSIYIAIQCVSVDEFELYIDAFSVHAPSTADLALNEPSSGYACDLTATTQIPVEVENAGADMIASGESFTFTVESEGTTVLTEDFTLDTDLNAGETWNGVTTNTIDLSAIGATFYTASITYAEDINTDNDTIHGYIVHFEQTLEFTDAVNDTITINASDYPYTIETSLTINPDSTLVTEYLWEDGSTTSTFTATQDDWYTVTIITDGECELTDSVFVRAFNAIETNNNNEFAIFPNPSNGQFTIEMTLAEKQDVIITIVNTNGQVVREMKFDDINKLAREINMSDVAEGLYNIRINAGGEMTNRQIIIR